MSIPQTVIPDYLTTVSRSREISRELGDAHFRLGEVRIRLHLHGVRTKEQRQCNDVGNPFLHLTPNTSRLTFG